MHSVWTYGQNFEILKFSAAPETHFKSIFKFGRDKSDVCGLGHPGSQPFNYSPVKDNAPVVFLLLYLIQLESVDTFSFTEYKFPPLKAP